MKLRSWLLFLLLAFIWGTNWSVMKMGLDFISPITFVLQRFLFSAIALSPLLFLFRKKIPRDSNTLGKLFLLCLINALGVASTNIGLVHERSGLVAVLTYTQPLFVFCLAVPFLKEDVSAIRALGVVTGFLGVVILNLGKFLTLTSGSYFNLVLILGAFLWAVTVVYYKKYLTHVEPVLASFFQLAMGVLPLTILSLTMEGFTFPTSRIYIFTILYASLGASALGWTIWLFLLKEEDATIISTSSFIIPIIALFFGWQLLGERIEIETLFGAGLTLAGVYLVNLKRKRPQTG